VLKKSDNIVLSVELRRKRTISSVRLVEISYK